MGFPSKVRHAVDAEPSIVLRAESAAALTASGADAAISLNTLDTAYWHNGEIPFQTATVVVHVTAIDVSGDQEYTIQVEVDSDQAFAGADATVVASLDVAAPGVYAIVLDGPTIKDLRDDAKFIRTNTVAAGVDAKSIDFSAWLAPTVGNAA